MIDMTYWIEEVKGKIGLVAVLKHFWYVFFTIVVICIVINLIIPICIKDPKKMRNYIKIFPSVAIISIVISLFTMNLAYLFLKDKIEHQSFTQKVEEIYKISGLISENKDFIHYRYIPNSGTYKITYMKNNKKNTAELYINENKICILDENNEIIVPDN